MSSWLRNLIIVFVSAWLWILSWLRSIDSRVFQWIRLMLSSFRPFSAVVSCSLKLRLTFSAVQCWFKLTGQNELNFKFETRFSQIGLSLGENLWRQKFLKILAGLIWCNLFYEIRAQNSTPKRGRFGFSQLIKNYAKKYPVDHRHNYIKVSSLRSSTNFKKGIFSNTLYKLIYFVW